METWFVIVVSLCLSALIRSLLFRPKDGKKLPSVPGPSFLYTTFLLLTHSPLNFEPVLINLKTKYGPLFNLSIGFQQNIFVGSHSLAHQVLVQKGAVFSDRQKSSLTMLNIASATYGPTWRLFRRNLVLEIMHPSRIKSYSWGRKWVLRILIDRLQERHEADGIKVIDHFQYAIFCILVLMCFGEQLEERKISEIAKLQLYMLSILSSGSFAVITRFPKLGKIFFRNKWKEFEKLLYDKEQLLLPIIKSRIKSDNSKSKSVAYVDTLVNLEVPKEEGENGNDGKLTQKDMVSLCSEFLNGGTDTTSNAMHWIMANLVKYPHIQRKLYAEISTVVGPPPLLPPPGVEPELVINEEDLNKMPFLKAVVLEGLRRHPPAHFVLPHKVTKEVEVEGCTIPQGASINFMIAEMGQDPKVWDDPMEFKPERFLVNDASNGVFDLTGSKGIKMMPFGAGRRICPGSDLALLHLEYFVANLIWYFDWTTPDGYSVDLSEKVEFSVVMKNPLRTQISSRAEKGTT